MELTEAWKKVKEQIGKPITLKKAERDADGNWIIGFDYDDPAVMMIVDKNGEVRER